MDEKKQIEEMMKHCPFYKEGKCTLLEAVICDVNCDMCDFAKRLYNADFRKQSRGKWKQAYNSFPRYVCTNCNHLFNNKTFKYCPNCGAKMKGKEN